MNVLTTLKLLGTSVMLVGCSATVSQEALCSGTRTARDAHAVELLQDGNRPQTVITGATLINQLQEGCNE